MNEEVISRLAFEILLLFIVFFLGFCFGASAKTKISQNTYRTLYCQTFKETQQYIDCMNKPLDQGGKNEPSHITR